MKLNIFLVAVLFVAVVKSIPLTKTGDVDQEEVVQENFIWQADNSGPVAFAAEDDEKTYRLPNNSLPIRYDLWLKTDVDKENFDFSGQVKIHIKIIEPTQTITLHQRQLTIIKVDLLNVDGTVQSPGLTFQDDLPYEFLIISLPSMMSANDEILLDITYSGNLREDGSGFYRASYKTPENVQVWFATTQFEMTDARHAMPCYDEPGIRAVTNLQIQHDKSYHAISNMPLIGVPEPIDDTDYVTSKFMDTPRMQSYLLAFVISNYDFVSSNEVDLVQRVFAKPQSIADGEANFAASVVGPVLHKLQDVLGVDFPLEKMDHALIDDYIWGAMENFGLITYLESSMLYIEGRDSKSKEKSIIELVSHEYAHQWFGNIVNPSWWAYTWLNEGFATLFANYIPSLIYPAEDYMDRFRTGALATAFSVDTIAAGAVPLNYYVETPINIRNKFNSISYRKGGSFLRMFMEAMTVPTFLKGLNYYLNEMYYSPASPEDLHRNLQKAFDEDFPENGISLEQMMKPWEEQAGYPIIHVEKTGTTVTLTQKRFGGGNEIYMVPISFATLTSPTFDVKTPKVWLTSQSIQVPNVPQNDWIILNMQATGYYKVSYGQNAWEAILNGIKSNRLGVPTLHRAQLFTDMAEDLLDDTFYTITALELFELLSDEQESSVFSAAASVENVLSNRVLDSPLFTKYQEFIKSVLQPHFTRLGYEAINGESANDVSLRNVIVLMFCKMDDQECLEKETQKLASFVETGSGSYNLCYGIKLANAELHSTLVGRMIAAPSGNTRNNFINGLGCSHDRDILFTYLVTALSTENSLTANERVNIFLNTMGKSAVGLKATLDFVGAFYREINERTAISTNESILSRFTTSINNNANAETFKVLLGIIKNAGIVTQEEVDSMVATHEKRAAWSSENLWKIEAFLNDKEITDEPEPTTAPTNPTTVPTNPTTVPTNPTTLPTNPTTVPTNPTTLPTNPTTVPTNPTTMPTTQETASTTTDGSVSLASSLTAFILCFVFKFLM